MSNENNTTVDETEIMQSLQDQEELFEEILDRFRHFTAEVEKDVGPKLKELSDDAARLGDPVMVEGINEIVTTALAETMGRRLVATHGAYKGLVMFNSMAYAFGMQAPMLEAELAGGSQLDNAMSVLN